MEYLRDWSDAEIKAELGQFKGVGPKTTSCVLCFSMARDTEFPVDTHVWRIARERLGWVPKSASREETYTILNELLPNSIKYGLHVLLVKHGKVCPACSASKSSGATRPQDKKGLRSRPCVLTAGRKGAAGDKTMGSKLISLCK
jgi:endonuclease III